MLAHSPAPWDLDWRVSRTCSSGACVMVARSGDSVVFSNTRDPEDRFTHIPLRNGASFSRESSKAASTAFKFSLPVRMIDLLILRPTTGGGFAYSGTERSGWRDGRITTQPASTSLAASSARTSC